MVVQRAAAVTVEAVEGWKAEEVVMDQQLRIQSVPLPLLHTSPQRIDQSRPQHNRSENCRQLQQANK